jgi:hypothetical protein
MGYFVQLNALTRALKSHILLVRGNPSNTFLLRMETIRDETK